MIDFNSSNPLVQLNFITTPINVFVNDVLEGKASGFFFKHNNKRYLVTNRHVVINEKDKVFPGKLVIELHTQSKDIKDFEELEIDLYSNGQPIWLEHPNFLENECDVVLIEMPADIFNTYFLKCMTQNNFLNERQYDTIPDVLIVGYPLGFYDDLNCLPIYRKGTVASAFGHNFRDLPCFLIDASLHEGTSGAPVINSPHNTLQSPEGNFNTSSIILLGIHSAEHHFEGEPLGLNVVWYAQTLIEIIEFN